MTSVDGSAADGMNVAPDAAIDAAWLHRRNSPSPSMVVAEPIRLSDLLSREREPFSRREHDGSPEWLTGATLPAFAAGVMPSGRKLQRLAAAGEQLARQAPARRNRVFNCALAGTLPISPSRTR